MSVKRFPSVIEKIPKKKCRAFCDVVFNVDLFRCLKILESTIDNVRETQGHQKQNRNPKWKILLEKNATHLFIHEN